MDKQSVDILIVGGGLIGVSLMLALKQSGYRVLLVEANPFTNPVEEQFDARTLALSPATIRILETLSAWSIIESQACPIKRVHVSERGGFGSAQLNRDATTPLGYVVEMQHLTRALQSLVASDSVLAPAELIALEGARATLRVDGKEEQIDAQLIVAADGANSTVRRLCGLSVDKRFYNQHALVTNIGLARAHGHIAYERFTKTGPLAMLPMNGLRAALIWTLPPDEINHYMTLPEPVFLEKLQQTFGYRLGRFTQVGRRGAFPLQYMVMPQQIAHPVVFIGNAAHTLHPVAGQGFNLGLRDVAMLAQCIATEGLNADALLRYQEKRGHDQRNIVRFTDGLIRLFTSKAPGIGLARRLGLVAFDHSPALKKLLSRYARGFAGIVPDLVCGIPLQDDVL